MNLSIEAAITLLGLVVTLLLFGVQRIVSQLAGINTKLGTIAANFAGLDSWRETHDRRDDERFGEHGRRLVRLEEERLERHRRRERGGV